CRSWRGLLAVFVPTIASSFRSRLRQRFSLGSAVARGNLIDGCWRRAVARARAGLPLCEKRFDGAGGRAYLPVGEREPLQVKTAAAPRRCRVGGHAQNRADLQVGQRRGVG